MTQPRILTRAPGAAAFRKLVVVEGKLLLREPLPLFWGIAVPMVLLTVMGAFAGGQTPSSAGFG